ncbi:hypothetical protein ACI2OX_01490 [Bacillus sp. N9]
MFSGNDSDDIVNVYIHDELNLYSEIERIVEERELTTWNVEKTDLEEAAMEEQAATSEGAVYIALTKAGLEQGNMNMYLNDDVGDYFLYESSILEEPLRQLQMEQIGLTVEQKAAIANPITLQPIMIEQSDSGVATTEEEAGADPSSESYLELLLALFYFQLL